MAWELSGLSGLLFIATVILIALAGIGWYNRGNRIASFVVLMVTVAAWAAVYGIQLGYPTITDQLAWQRITLATSATVPPAFLVFAYQYAGKHGYFSGWDRYIAVGEALGFIALTLTNPYHHLVWSDASLTTWRSIPILDIEFAVGYYGHIVIAYFVVLLGLWAIMSVYFRSTAIYRSQSALLLAGALPAFLFHVLYTIEAGPVSGLDVTPFAFAITGVTFGSALFFFDLLERTPIAQQRALELTGDGLLVVDTNGIVVDSNRIARRIFSDTAVHGQNISSIMDERDPRDLHGETMTAVVDGANRVYDVFVSPLASESTPDAGLALVLRDVTDQKSYEQRLEVAYRVLRHNLRNEMNVITGRAEILLERATTPEQRELAEGIREKGADLLSISEQARTMVEFQDTGRSDRVSVPVKSVLDPVVTELRAEYPDVELAVDCPDDVRVSVLSERALGIALRNILENAYEHNETSSLAVSVMVSALGEHTRIDVSDTGSGLPEFEREVLQHRRETPLKHSSGLGLWLTYWIVSMSGGSIAVEASESAGTTVSLTFERDTPAHDPTRTSRTN